MTKKTTEQARAGKQSRRIPRPSGDAEKLLDSVLPKDPRIEVRPLFGNNAAFVNGNLFAGVYGSELFVRLPEEGRADLLKEKGSSAFEPMKGRPMKEYVVVPPSWHVRPEIVERWVSRSLGWVAAMPPKQRKPRRP